MHCTGAPPRSVLSILHPAASSAHGQRESAQAVGGREQEVVGGHIGQEEGKEEVVVEHIGMGGKCEAEERNCCSAAGVW